MTAASASDKAFIDFAKAHTRATLGVELTNWQIELLLAMRRAERAGKPVLVVNLRRSGAATLKEIVRKYAEKEKTK